MSYYRPVSFFQSNTCENQRRLSRNQLFLFHAKAQKDAKTQREEGFKLQAWRSGLQVARCEMLWLWHLTYDFGLHPFTAPPVLIPIPNSQFLLPFTLYPTPFTFRLLPYLFLIVAINSLPIPCVWNPCPAAVAAPRPYALKPAPVKGLAWFCFSIMLWCKTIFHER